MLADLVVTDADGRFEMGLDGGYLDGLFPDGVVPEIWFRVFDGARLLADTRGTVTWRPNGQPAHVRIVVDMRDLPEDTADPAPLVVQGLVADGVDGPLADISVQAADRVLRDGRLVDVQVGSAVTDGRGRYRMEYTPTAGKVKADLTVRALDRAGVEIVQSEVWCHAPANATVDLVRGTEVWPGPSEHDIATSRLGDVELADIDDDVAEFLACSRGIPAEQLDRLRTSARLARDHRISPELLYALGSQGLPVDLRSLLAAEPTAASTAVERALGRNTVPQRIRGTLGSDIEAVRGAVVTQALAPAVDRRISVGDVLATGTTERAVHQAFLERFVARPGTVQDFWSDLVRQPPFDQAGVVEDLQLSLQLSLVTQGNVPLLRALTARRADGSLRALADLTVLDHEDWRQLLTEAGAANGGVPPIPPDIPGDTVEDRTERYLDSIVEPLQDAFPGRYLRRSITRTPEIDVALVRELHRANGGLDPRREPLPDEPNWGSIPDDDRDRARAAWERLRAEALAFPDLDTANLLGPAGSPTFANPLRAGVDKLLTNLGDPDLRTTNLDQVIAEHGGDAAFAAIPEADRPAVLRQAKTYQRIHATAPRAQHVEALLGAGFHSAFAIATTSPKLFARQLGAQLGGEDTARTIHGKARMKAGSTHATLTNLKQAYLDVKPWVLQSPEPEPIEGQPDLESLFGQQALCDCGHCRSVYSPAAYLVRLLQFLGPKVRGRLLARRPDIGHILLTCENTTTTVPYIDLVNEILEWRVANPSAPLPAGDTEGATSAELRAVPQHVVQSAYDAVYEAAYPLTLPFHRPSAVTRAYLGHLGVSREELLELFRPGADPWDEARVAETLLMSPREYQILTKTLASPLPLHQAYGLDLATWKQEVVKAPVFLRQTGLVFADLVDLVETWFVNRNQSVPAQRIALDAPGECDVAGTTITHLDDDGDVALDRIHRFLRLWRRTGWTMADLDRALFALGATDIDATALRKLAQLRRLMAELKLPLAEALALVAPIDTWGDDAHYLKLFRNRAVARLEDASSFALHYPFSNDPANPDPDPDIKDPALPFELADPTRPLSDDPRTAVVLAALRITEPDLDLVRAYAGIPADAAIDLALLSRLYRYAVLARRLRLRVPDLMSLLRLTGLDPFQPQEPAGVLDFVTAVARVKHSGMKVETLDYLYRHALRPTQGPAPVAEDVTATLDEIAAGLRQLRDDLVDSEDPTGGDLRAKLGLAFPPDIVVHAMAIVLGDAGGLPADPAAFLAQHFGAFADPQEAASTLLQALPLSDQQRLDNIAWVRARLLPWLRVTLSRGIVVTTLADAVGLAPPLVGVLLATHLSARVAAAGQAIDDFLTLAAATPEPGHAAGYELLHKAALLIDGLGLTEQEVTHLLAQPTQFGGWTFDGLPLSPVSDAESVALFASWQRVADLVSLRAELPQGDRTLVDLFETAVPQGEDSLTLLATVLAEVTGWDITALTALAGPLGLTEADFRAESRLLVVRDCLAVARRVGLVAETLFGWAADEPDTEHAGTVVQAVKSRYEPERWLEVARALNDGLREAQRTALVDYLVPRMADDGVDSPDRLFEHFLVDSGMQSCMLTSRIRLALSSVQLFVQRCLLNLEDGVEPDDIDAEQWKWRRLYRVDEANQKVFLYAENWIEPGLLVDKTPFLRLLETELLQNELTDEYVEQAYLNYLRRLDEVARLDVRAMHWEKEPGIDRLHVVARTPSQPFRYYYRRFENGREWTPWEHVDLDIEDAPHVLLMIHNRRLQLVWTTFTRKPSPVQLPSNPDGLAPPVLVMWDIQLACSEYRQQAWSPKQVSRRVSWSKFLGFLDSELPDPDRLMCHVHHDGDRVRVHIAWDLGYSQFFQRKVRLAARFGRDGATAAFAGRAWDPDGSFGSSPPEWWYGTPLNGDVDGTTTALADQLWLHSTDVSMKHILKELPSRARMIRSNLTEDLRPPGYYPFFLEDGRRSWFAYPVPATDDAGLLLNIGSVDVGPGLLVGLDDFLLSTQPAPASIDPVATEQVAGPTGAQTLALQTGGTTYGESLQDTSVNPTTVLVEALERDLRFTTFWHPLVPELVRVLNRDGIPGLLTLANQQKTLDGPTIVVDLTLFTQTYEPTGNVARPRPRADVDFASDGAYSAYNWELFFHVPMLVAERLRQEGRWSEARRWIHYVFDPTTDEAGETPRRFWRFKPFHDNDEYARVQEMLELLSYTGGDKELLARKKRIGEQVQEWLDHPFEPHRIARLRLVAYQKHVVMRYVDILLEEADALFRRDTIESINEATQLYLLAANILGPRPQRVPARATVAPKHYHQLQAEGLDEFANAAVALENVLFPYLPPSDSGGDGNGADSGADTILAAGETLYFCAPNNDKLLGYWDQVEDRLFKIRHCLNIAGVARQLALFDPPIDPAALVRAAASGADLDSVLGDLFAPLPPYRFSYLLTKASELCAEVKSLGAQLLSALQSRDAEKLAHIRAVQEETLLEAVKAVKEQQIEEAESAKAALELSLKTVTARRDFYAAIERVSTQEQEQLDRLVAAQTDQEKASLMHVVAAAIRAGAPKVTVGGAGTMGSPVTTLTWDGDNWAAGAEGLAHAAGWMAGYDAYKANMASIKAGHARRWADWKLQEELAGLEMAQIDEQIAGAELRRQVAEKELANHELQIAHAAETEELLRRKFTNEELYGWMMSQVSALYFQAYKLAYDVAKRAERAYRFERGLETSGFVTFGYWDGLRKGLLAGERLSLDLRRLEAAYLEQNRRDYELTLRVPLSQWDPQALIQLKTSGMCEVDLTEELYDANGPGHYFRRIKSLGLTVACVTGPYANINATVTMLGNRIRTSSSTAAPYREQPPDDSRFLYDFASSSRVATSHGNDDSGVRELNFRDERYLPFEGAGAICRLRVDMRQDSNSWDLATTSEVVVTVRFDAREGGELLRAAAQTSLQELLGIAPSEDGAHSPPLRRLLSARHELSEAWHRFLHPADDATAQELAFELTPEHYPYLLRRRQPEITAVDVFVWPKTGAVDPVPPEGLPVTLTLPDETTVDMTLTPAAPGDPIGLAHASSSDSISPDQTTGPWKLTIPAASGPVVSPDAVHDLVVVLTYYVTE